MLERYGGQGNRPKPREKIRGSQHVNREEKIRPKVRWNPFEKWKKKQRVTNPTERRMD